jgi:transcriptional repressor NrdR
VKANLKVFKRDGRHEDLSKQKLTQSISIASQKRPVSTQDIEVIVDSIINELETEFEREVPSTVIGRKVMDKLEKTDEVAFVRFASVYRRFRDATQFMNEVEALRAKL